LVLSWLEGSPQTRADRVGTSRVVEGEMADAGKPGQTPKKGSLLVIIPARNEADRIPLVIRKIHSVVPHATILVVEDSSNDDTVLVARAEGALVISLPINIGYGGALQTGFKYAWNEGYERVVTLDADGQHNPDDIPKLLAKLEERGADLVIGSRFVEDTGYETGGIRRATMKFFSVLTSYLAGQKVADTTSGFQAIGRMPIGLFAEVYPYDYPNAEVIVDLARHGGKIAEVAIKVHARLGGTSMFDLWSSLYYVVKMNLSILMVLLRKRRR